LDKERAAVGKQIADSKAKELAKQKEITASKKLGLDIDKANLLLGKGQGIFNMDAINLNAAMLNQADQLKNATSTAQILQIENDMARLNVKKDMLDLESAIAAKDDAAIVKLTAKLNTDLAILGVLSGQNIKLSDIKAILDSLKPKDLINLQNLRDAYDMMLRLLSAQGVKIATSGATDSGASAGGNLIATARLPFPTTPFPDVSATATEANRERGGLQNVPTVVNISAGVIADPNAFIGLIQDAIQRVNHFGGSLTSAGAL